MVRLLQRSGLLSPPPLEAVYGPTVWLCEAKCTRTPTVVSSHALVQALLSSCMHMRRDTARKETNTHTCTHTHTHTHTHARARARRTRVSCPAMHARAISAAAVSTDAHTTTCTVTVKSTHRHTRHTDTLTRPGIMCLHVSDHRCKARCCQLWCTCSNIVMRWTHTRGGYSSHWAYLERKQGLLREGRHQQSCKRNANDAEERGRPEDRHLRFLCHRPHDLSTSLAVSLSVSQPAAVRSPDNPHAWASDPS